MEGWRRPVMVEVWVAGRWVVSVVEVWLFFGAAVGEEEMKKR